MTKGRLVGTLCVASGVIMTVWGLTDRKVTELLYGSWAPVLIGVAVLALSRGRVQRPIAETGSFGDPRLDALARAHEFTRAQLEENRAGRIHPDQIAAGLRRGRANVVAGNITLGIGFVLFVAGLALPWFPAGDFAVPAKVAGAIVVGTMIGGLLATFPLCIAIVTLRGGRPVIDAYSAGVAKRVEGRLQKRRVGNWPYYVVAGRRLGLVNGGWNHAIEGANHRVFYAPGCNEVLSLEPVQ